MSKYKVAWSSRFKKDYKKAKKRNKDTHLLDDAIRSIANGEELPEAMHDHELTGEWKGARECHIEPDWLMVYERQDDKLVLVLLRTGSHSDLFG